MNYYYWSDNWRKGVYHLADARSKNGAKAVLCGLELSVYATWYDDIGGAHYTAQGYEAEPCLACLRAL